MRWANVINALVGIWFIIAPFVLKYDDMRYAMYASIVGGALMLVLAGWAEFSEEGRVSHITWTSAVGVLIALGLSTYQLVRVLPREARA